MRSEFAWMSAWASGAASGKSGARLETLWAPETAGAHQLKQRGEAGLLHAEIGPGAAEMNDDQRHRHVHELILQRVDGGDLSLGLHMPTVAPGDLLRRLM